MAESWRDLRPGDRVVLVATGAPGKWEPEELHGAHGQLIELTRAHGYARVRWDHCPAHLLAPGAGATYLVHPESLVKEESDAAPPARPA